MINVKVYLKSHRWHHTLVTFLLAFLLLFIVVRFVIEVLRFGNESLQLDFASYYTAGESLNYGLSPYKNNIYYDPPLWDGIARYKYSRFLYPPLVASLFQPIAKLPYAYAKFLWMGVTLICIYISLQSTEKLFPLRKLNLILLTCIFALLFFPLLICLERGQIDAVTLMFIAIAFALSVEGGRKKGLLSGCLLAFATLFKLYAVFLLPFLILKKRFDIVQGYIYGSITIVVATIIVQSGPHHIYDYIYNQLPRMANIGDIAKSNTLVDKKLIQAVLEQVPNEFDTIKDGRPYLLGSMEFTANATLVEPVQKYLESRNIYMSAAAISIALFGLFFFGAWIWGKHFIPLDLPMHKEYIYWQIPLMIILLVSPLTWVMNTIWFLPMIVIVISLMSRPATFMQKLALIIIAVGIGIAMVPDALNAPIIFSALNLLYAQKYIYAELVALVGILFYLSLAQKDG